MDGRWLAKVILLSLKKGITNTWWNGIIVVLQKEIQRFHINS
jgi:hypothetical protein